MSGHRKPRDANATAYLPIEKGDNLRIDSRPSSGIRQNSKHWQRTTKPQVSSERDMLAIVHFMHKWRHYLEGTHFHVQTDKVNLKCFTTTYDLSCCIAKFSEYVARFDYTTEYISGKLDKGADALSRFPVQNNATVYSGFSNFDKVVLDKTRNKQVFFCTHSTRTSRTATLHL